MRRNLLPSTAADVDYEIREIVNVALQFESEGVEILWENIGDPIAKGTVLPEWIRETVADLALDSRSYGYSTTKGIAETRQFLAERNNALGGTQIGADDILFFNGVGDAIATVYRLLDGSARVILPSPVYSTHSSAEATHARKPAITFKLDPEDNWNPDLADLRRKVHANPGIVAILIINPDNPSGMVYSESQLREIVSIARDHRLFIIADEIYTRITYDGARAVPLAAVIGDVCGMAMKGVSKEVPWPGARCGWLEFYNTSRDEEFARLVAALEDAKMMEVCSTTLPQLAIPRIFGHPGFDAHRERLNAQIEKRAAAIYDALRDIPELIVNRTYGAFYTGIVFREGALNARQKLAVPVPGAAALATRLAEGVPLDKRFVYYLLAATGICVVPISSFCSELRGFRITLLEEDPGKMEAICTRLRTAVKEYVASA